MTGQEDAGRPGMKTRLAVGRGKGGSGMKTRLAVGRGKGGLATKSDHSIKFGAGRLPDCNKIAIYWTKLLLLNFGVQQNSDIPAELLLRTAEEYTKKEEKEHVLVHGWCPGATNQRFFSEIVAFGMP